MNRKRYTFARRVLALTAIFLSLLVGSIFFMEAIREIGVFGVLVLVITTLVGAGGIDLLRRTIR